MKSTSSSAKSLVGTEQVSEAPTVDEEAGPQAPYPSRLPVIMFYVSALLGVMGVIMLIRYAFFVKDGETEGNLATLVVGGALVAAALAVGGVMGWLYDRENKKYVAYIKAKAEEIERATNARHTAN